VQWTITIEGADEFDCVRWAQIEIEKDFDHSQMAVLAAPSS